MGSQAPDQRPEAPQLAGLDAVADAGTVDVTANEAHVLEHLEVLGHGGLREVELFDDVAADAAVVAREQAQDSNASRMPERLGERRELLVGVAPLDGTKVGLVVRGRAAGP